MTTALKKPCKACPWRKDSAAGWLGASTPVEFLQQSEAEIHMPCHLHVDYERDDWEEQASSAPQCAGRAVHFANRCKKPQNPGLITMPANHAEIFGNPQDFVAHHTLPGEPVPRIFIMGPRVQVDGTMPRSTPAANPVASKSEQVQHDVTVPPDADTVQAGTATICPHCKKAQEGAVEDYVVPGLIGAASSAKDQCEHCYKPFTVRCVAPNRFVVSKAR
ncbi:hypothetical protein [Pseudomonas putida]|uniref:Uncharacterized protein n=1 Tax=Pseudomonas putida TaxID=303 RepID=A0A8I1ED49_PSEPU|nr:hypothetical protein [Pseudomonas putida]MBI6883078.1 hypothetical protein [Pseudomonas putida]